MYHAPHDMTVYDRIRELVHWADTALENANVQQLTLDLSRLIRLDSSFVAGVILVCRRARRHGVSVRIIEMPKRFETLVDLYHIRTALVEAGVVFEGSEDETAAATQAEMSGQTANGRLHSKFVESPTGSQPVNDTFSRPKSSVEPSAG